MENGQEVRIFTDSIVGWEDGILVEQYEVINKSIIERWGIETESGAFIVRYVKKSSDLKTDGCGYLI